MTDFELELEAERLAYGLMQDCDRKAGIVKLAKEWACKTITAKDAEIERLREALKKVRAERNELEREHF